MAAIRAEQINPFLMSTRQVLQQVCNIEVQFGKIENADKDYIQYFLDSKNVSKGAYSAMNALIAKNFMRGDTDTLLAPTSGISASDARITMDNIVRRRVAPVWSWRKSGCEARDFAL